MSDRETEDLLRAWLGSEHGTPAPATLRARVMSIPTQDRPRSAVRMRPAGPSWFAGQRRLLEIAVALMLLALLAALIGTGAFGGGRPPLGLIAPSSSPATPTPALSPSPSIGPIASLGYRGNGTIAFVRTDPLTNLDKTWLVDPAGSRESILQPNVGRASPSGVTGFGCCPVFAPNGEQVAVGYEEIDSFRGPGAWQTATVLRLDGSPASLVPVFCGSCASTVGLNYLPRAWSPDGTTVAIEGWSDAKPAIDGIELAPVGQEADWSTQVTGAHRDVPVAFSPDGARLLFVRIKTADRSGDLFVLTIRTGAVRQVNPTGTLLFADDYFGPAASWSPDSSQIAFAATNVSGNTGQMSAFVASPDGSHLRSIVGPTPYLTTAKWSPKGAWIALDQEGLTSAHDLYLIDPDGSGLTSLTGSFPAGLCCARWSPDGTALLAAGTVTTDEESYLFIVPLNGGPIAQVTTVPALYHGFSWGLGSR